MKVSRCYNYINKGTTRHFSFMPSKIQKFTVYLAHKKYHPFYYKILSLEAALALELIWLDYGWKILNLWNLVHTRECLQESFSMADLSRIWKLHSLEHQCPLFLPPRWGRPHTSSRNMKGFCHASPITSKQHCGLCVNASLKCCLHYPDQITSGSAQTSEKVREKSDAENELQFFRQQRVGYFLGTSQVEKLSSPAAPTPSSSWGPPNAYITQVRNMWLCIFLQLGWNILILEFADSVLVS